MRQREDTSASRETHFGHPLAHCVMLFLPNWDKRLRVNFNSRVNSYHTMGLIILHRKSSKRQYIVIITCSSLSLQLRFRNWRAAQLKPPLASRDVHLGTWPTSGILRVGRVSEVMRVSR